MEGAEGLAAEDLAAVQGRAEQADPGVVLALGGDARRGRAGQADDPDRRGHGGGRRDRGVEFVAGPVDDAGRGVAVAVLRQLGERGPAEVEQGFAEEDGREDRRQQARSSGAPARAGRRAAPSTPSGRRPPAGGRRRGRSGPAMSSGRRWASPTTRPHGPDRRPPTPAGAARPPGRRTRARRRPGRPPSGRADRRGRARGWRGRRAGTGRAVRGPGRPARASAWPRRRRAEERPTSSGTGEPDSSRRYVTTIASRARRVCGRDEDRQARQRRRPSSASRRTPRRSAAGRGRRRG